MAARRVGEQQWTKTRETGHAEAMRTDARNRGWKGASARARAGTQATVEALFSREEMLLRPHAATGCLRGTARLINNGQDGRRASGAHNNCPLQKLRTGKEAVGTPGRAPHHQAHKIGTNPKTF